MTVWELPVNTLMEQHKNKIKYTMELIAQNQLSLDFIWYAKSELKEN